MALSKEAALTVGIATSALVYGIHNAMLPPTADIRAEAAGNPHAMAATKQATALSVAVVAGISLLAQDRTVFIIGGATALLMAWTDKAATLYDPVLRRTIDPSEPMVAAADGAGFAE